MTKLGGSEPSEILPKLAWGGGPPKAVEGQVEKVARQRFALPPPQDKLGEE